VLANGLDPDVQRERGGHPDDGGRGPSRPFEAMRATRCLPRATQGLYTPGSVFKIVTSVAGLGSAPISPSTTFKDQPTSEKSGWLIDGFRVRDGHHPFTGDNALDFAEAVEVSLQHLVRGWRASTWAARKLSSWAERLGFGDAIPFDLPTSASQVTNGGGSLGGGFKSRVELANAAYGQGETLATPLQMALVAATVANDGVLMKPRLVTALTSSKTGRHDIGASEWRRVIGSDTAHVIRDAMLRAVEGEFGRLYTTGAAVPGFRRPARAAPRSSVARASRTPGSSGSRRPTTAHRDRGRRGTRRPGRGAGGAPGRLPDEDLLRPSEALTRGDTQWRDQPTPRRCARTRAVQAAVHRARRDGVRRHRAGGARRGPSRSSRGAVARCSLPRWAPSAA
jgi:hypothetical protein